MTKEKEGKKLVLACFACSQTKKGTRDFFFLLWSALSHQFFFLLFASFHPPSLSLCNSTSTLLHPRHSHSHSLGIIHLPPPPPPPLATIPQQLGEPMEQQHFIQTITALFMRTVFDRDNPQDGVFCALHTSAVCVRVCRPPPLLCFLFSCTAQLRFGLSSTNSTEHAICWSTGRMQGPLREKFLHSSTHPPTHPLHTDSFATKQNRTLSPYPAIFPFSPPCFPTTWSSIFSLSLVGV